MKKIFLLAISVLLLLSVSIVFATEEELLVSPNPETEVVNDAESVEVTAAEVSDDEDYTEEVEAIDSGDLEILDEDEDMNEDMLDTDTAVDEEESTDSSNKGSIVGAIIAVVIVVAVVAVAAILRKD